MSIIADICPSFGYDYSFQCFSLTEQCAPRLQALGARTTTTPSSGDPSSDLIAIYVTESPEAYYDNFGPLAHGRMVALVRPQPMPPGRDIWSYASGCLEFKRNQLLDRWPIGWPSDVVFYSPYGGPVLRDAFFGALGRSDYSTLTHAMLQGPIDLGQWWLRPLAAHLMNEIRHMVTFDPRTQILPLLTPEMRSIFNGTSDSERATDTR